MDRAPQYRRGKRDIREGSLWDGPTHLETKKLRIMENPSAGHSECSKRDKSFVGYNAIEPLTLGVCLIPLVTTDDILGLFSRDASTNTIQSMLTSPQSGVYHLNSNIRHAPEHDLARSASFGSAPPAAAFALSTLGRPPAMSSLMQGVCRVPPSTIGQDVLHDQHLRAKALCHVRHQRQVIANLRASLQSSSTTMNGSIVSASGSSVSRVSSPGTVASHDQRMRLSPRMASPEMISMDAIPMDLPVIFAQSTDSLVLTGHQALLREQIELFSATHDFVSSPARGRNKRIELGQVGIRCRHCAHVPAARRPKGSAYFPATLLGLYQAAQNMSSNHIQCGLCPEMPQSLKDKFTELFPTKAQSSGAGRSYWANSAKQLGMVDTERGIRFVRDL
jgi:hypothetical protein